MDRVSGKLTVFFENPFWAGVFERQEGRDLSVCKVTFGAEPKDYEIYEFVLKRYHELKFGPAVEAEIRETRVSFKRMQREIRRQAQGAGVGTKSQQALRLQREQEKTQRKEISREKNEAEKLRRFECRRQKRKEKHRGH